MINQYKRTDVFRCGQEAHQRFDGKISVYHVLKEKACYPQGCLYFLWHCVLLEKGRRCIHGYGYAGKKCKGCTYYDEEKVHLQPTLLLNQDAYAAFLEELDTFEEWLERVRFRYSSINGRIKSVKPWLEERLLHREKRTNLRGYILVFNKGFIGNTLLNDQIYIRVSEGLMKQYRFAPGMLLEMSGEVREDRGRIVVHRPKRIEVLKHGWGQSWTRERSLVAVKTATLLEAQPDRCLGCRWGVLVDVEDLREHQKKRYRRLYCLQSITDSNGCYVRVSAANRKTPGMRPLIVRL